jgi:hypothetical protein
MEIAHEAPGIRLRAGPEISCRNTANHRISRNIVDDDRICADDHVIPYRNPAQHLGAGANLHAAANPGRARWVIRTAVSQRHPLTNQAVISDQ